MNLEQSMQFDRLVRDIRGAFLTSAQRVDNARWQSIRSPQPTYELLNYSFTLDLPTREVQFYKSTILPNLPWAEDHFLKERVSGHPLNPGQEWRNWPYARSANTHRRPGEVDPQFDHSYAERYWPRYAGFIEGGVIPDGYVTSPHQGHHGIRFRYGDLDDLVKALAAEPTTRQAVLPVWFPEDLGAVSEGKRVPCSLGYHFIMREDRLHIVYYIRSCDLIRHFRDDVYMTIRLLLWVRDRVEEKDPSWKSVSPGTLTMHITSFHLFESDYKLLQKC